MSKIIEYKVVVAGNVPEFLEKGWQPLGGVSAVREEMFEGRDSYTITSYYQTIVKYAPIRKRKKGDK